MTPKSGNMPCLPPVPEKQPLRRIFHGYSLCDDYHWLRADKWQEVMQDPDKLETRIRDFLEAENSYTTAVLKDTEQLQSILFEEMKGRIKEDDSTVPMNDGPYAYYVSFITGGQHPIFCRRPREGSEERVLVDGNALAEGHAYFRFGSVSHSPEHTHVIYGVDDKGSEFYTLRILEPSSGKVLDEIITNTGGGAVWANNGQVFYYTRLDDNHRPRWVYRHRLGTSQEDDELIYEEPDTGFFVSVGATQSRKFILINAHDHQTSEIRLVDAESDTAVPQLVCTREAGHEYSVEHRGDDLIILTNNSGAEDFKIVRTPIALPDQKNWSDIETHKPGRLILDMAVLSDHLVRLEREDGLPRIVIRQFDDGAEHAISFDEEAYSLSMSAGYEYETHEIRFSYSSMTTPNQTYDYNMETRHRRLRKTQEVPSGHIIESYVTRRLMAPAHDGEQVPVTLLHHRDTLLDGSAPTLLYGYGAYGISIPASFSTSILSLVDRGFIYAIAHIRGGKDRGYRWYRQGRRDQKSNSFKDFISVGEFLVEEGLTTKGNIVGHGGSAGGMLMGAVANMAPDLFKAIIAEVPFVDVLNTILDETLPLTPPEWPEWGNPIESKEAYEWIAAYSPYDNVTAQDYPHMLALAGLTDPRVTYWEPAKWIARLRTHNTSDNLLLLKTNMEAGHGGASGRFDRLKEVALYYAFALKVTNKTDVTVK